MIKKMGVKFYKSHVHVLVPKLTNSKLHIYIAKLGNTTIKIRRVGKYSVLYIYRFGTLVKTIKVKFHGLFKFKLMRYKGRYLFFARYGGKVGGKVLKRWLIIRKGKKNQKNVVTHVVTRNYSK